MANPGDPRPSGPRLARADTYVFRRSQTDRVIAGVAGGLGERLGVDPFLVRIAFVVLAFAGGAGVVLYLLGWAVSQEPDAAAQEPRPAVREPDLQQAAALGLIVLGVLLLLRTLGLWLGDTLVWPVVVAAIGSAVLWTRGSADDRARWASLAARIPGNPVEAVFAGRVSSTRIVVGGFLVAAGMAAFLAANDAIHGLQNLLAAVAVTVIGASLVLGPWVWRLVQQLRDERRERIRSEERAALAAHLHDSVLQTLALIQRSADQPRRMASLARRQERELRAWLYGHRSEPAVGTTLRGAVDAIAVDVETDHDVSVEVVVVGDAPVDASVRALLAAAREAAVNAAKHAGVDEVAMFVEARPGVLEAFVRDRGRGFDPATVPADRRGIAGSIVGRMTRAGGTADVFTTPGEGTEVVLILPRDGHARDDEEPHA